MLLRGLHLQAKLRIHPFHIGGVRFLSGFGNRNISSDDKTILPSSLPKCFHISQIRMFQRFTAQFGTHMIRHCQTHWQQVIAVKNRRNIQFSVFCRNFCNICHALLQRCICCEITFQKIIRFVCFPVSFRDSIGFPLRFLANSIACTLYSSSYSLFFDIFLSSVFPFFYFIPLWLTCQVLLYRISLPCFYYDFVEMIQLS